MDFSGAGHRPSSQMDPADNKQWAKRSARLSSRQRKTYICGSVKKKGWWLGGGYRQETFAAYRQQQTWGQGCYRVKRRLPSFGKVLEELGRHLCLRWYKLRICPQFILNPSELCLFSLLCMLSPGALFVRLLQLFMQCYCMVLFWPSCPAQETILDCFLSERWGWEVVTPDNNWKGKQ